MYQNYPALIDTMACPTDIDFSPNSGYMAVGTNKGVVRMYRLVRHHTSLSKYMSVHVSTLVYYVGH